MTRSTSKMSRDQYPIPIALRTVCCFPEDHKIVAGLSLSLVSPSGDDL